MSDGEPTTPAPRKRPSFGLPGPTQPVPGAEPQPGPSQHGEPRHGSWQGSPYAPQSSSDPQAHGRHGGYDGLLPPSVSHPSPPAARPGVAAACRRS